MFLVDSRTNIFEIEEVWKRESNKDILMTKKETKRKVKDTADRNHTYRLHQY
jgi:hypothetical protein